MWRVADYVERRRQFLEEQIRRRVAVSAPPAVDFENLYSASGVVRTGRVTGSAQFVENRGSRSKTTRLRGLPRRRERLVQRATLLVCEVVALVVCNQVDNRSLGQCCRLVEDEPAFLDAGSKRAHRPYCKGFRDGQQGVRLHAEVRRFVRSHAATWFQLARHEGRQYSYALFRRAPEQTSMVPLKGSYGVASSKPSCWWTP